jgi:hypothetical protein
MRVSGMAEQFTATKGLVLAGALVVNGLGDEIFAGATFALDENCAGFAGCDFANEVEHFLHLLRFGDDLVISGTPAYLSARLSTFIFQATGF